VRVHEFLVIPDGESVIGAFYGGDFGVWSLPEGQLIRTPDPEDYSRVSALSADGRYLALSSSGDVESWDNELTFIFTQAYVASFSPDSTLLATEFWDVTLSGREDGTLALWEVPIMRLAHRVRPRTDIVMAISFTPDGQLIISGAMDGVVRLWGIP
jgi:WD40 repeat protein